MFLELLNKERMTKMKFVGLKAQAKRFLRAKGIKEVKTDTGVRKLDNAKTIYLVKKATELGW